MIDFSLLQRRARRGSTEAWKACARNCVNKERRQQSPNAIQIESMLVTDGPNPATNFKIESDDET